MNLDLELLIRAMREKIEYHASVGVGLRMQVLVAAQNEEPVKRALGEIVHNVLRGIDWDTGAISENELSMRTAILLKDLFYSKRIVVEVKVKHWPETAGTHLGLSVSNWDYILFDQTTCENYLTYLERN